MLRARATVTLAIIMLWVGIGLLAASVMFDASWLMYVAPLVGIVAVGMYATGLAASHETARVAIALKLMCGVLILCWLAVAAFEYSQS
jgi:positive regulator of sigma E activity